MLENKKLKNFKKSIEDFKTENPSVQFTDQQLVSIYYEHKLKEIYFRYVKLAVDRYNDSLYFYRKGLNELLIELLSEKPENEEFILTNVINKFGDPETSLITHLNRNLGLFLNKHSRMTWILIKEVEKFVLRPNIKMTA